MAENLSPAMTENQRLFGRLAGLFGVPGGEDA